MSHVYGMEAEYLYWGREFAAFIAVFIFIFLLGVGGTDWRTQIVLYFWLRDLS